MASSDGDDLETSHCSQVFVVVKEERHEDFEFSSEVSGCLQGGLQII